MDGLLVVDSTGNITLINEPAAELFGVSLTAPSFSTIASSIDLLSTQGELLSREQWPSDRALRGEFVQDFEAQIRRKDTGVTALVQISTLPINDRTGSTLQFVVTYRNITERDRIETERALSAAIIECSDDAIIGKDLDGNVTSWNNGATKIFGYTAEEMIGNSIAILLPQGKQDEEDVILRRLKDGETVDHIESVRIRKDGLPIYISLTISPIRGVDGSVVGASKIARDISARKHAEPRLLQSRKLEAIGQLAGGVAHDFNNLLAVVLGALELQRKRITDDPEALRFWGMANKAAMRGADLTRRLLAFSSKKQFKFAPTGVPTTVRNMVELASRLVGPEIDIILNLSESMPPVHTDQASLESVLLNLTLNARDAMPRGGTINIETKVIRLEAEYVATLNEAMKAEAYACITVRDTGTGMTPEVLERACEPFFTTKARGRGTGLGLSMVYGFVIQSGGGVHIDSIPGAGTTISLYLPLAEDSSKPSDRNLEHAERRARSGVVLVVDDEEDLVGIASLYLKALGYETLNAFDGADALRIVKMRNDVDVMLTDIVMPGGMDGVEVARLVRQLNPQIGIVYTSGFPSDALSERILSTNDCLILQKPYELSELGAAIDLTMGLDQGRRSPKAQ